jgi:predicted HTH transcriptional regulator
MLTFDPRGLFEKLGSGFITLFSSYEKYGLKPPQIIQGENYIKCILPRGASTKSLATNPEFDKILALFGTAHEISISDIIRELSVSRATAIRRANKMIAQGLIKRIGSTKAIRYTQNS